MFPDFRRSENRFGMFAVGGQRLDRTLGSNSSEHAYCSEGTRGKSPSYPVALAMFRGNLRANSGTPRRAFLHPQPARLERRIFTASGIPNDLEKEPTSSSE